MESKELGEGMKFLKAIIYKYRCKAAKTPNPLDVRFTNPDLALQALLQRLQLFLLIAFDNLGQLLDQLVERTVPS